jgi:integrase
LRKAHVVPILRSLADRAPTQCERAQELLQAVLNHAVALDLLEFNPLQKLPQFGATRIGERHLTPEEAGVYLKTIATLPVVDQSFFYLLILYGARPGELAAWQWAWIGADRIAIPGESQKNGRPLVLPLTPSAERVLTTLRAATGKTSWLFPNTSGTSSRLSFRKHKLRIEKKMSASKPWTLRDIRRTTETLLRELGTLPHTVSAILNHNTSQLGKVYDKSTNLGDKRRAIFRFEEYLERLKLGKTDDKVIELGRKVG